jgi:hypothetical protein
MTGVAKWAAADPLHAAKFTLDNPAGFASQMAMETIGKEWAKKDPTAALDFAAQKPGTLTAALARTALKEWATKDVTEAAAWLSSADVSTRNRFGSAFVESWAKTDAAAALDWCDSNLTGTSLAQSVGSVMKGIAAKDLPRAAGLVAAMHPSAMRSEAAVAVVQKWMPDYSSTKPVPPETSAWLANLDGDSVKRVLDEVKWRWSESDPKSLADFLSRADADKISAQTYSTVARSMARKNPNEAIQWASQLPAEQGVPAGSEAFSEWRRSQPMSALEWLMELPTTDPRRDAFFKDAVRDLAHEPNASDQFAMMKPSDRVVARKLLEKMPLPEDRRATLLGLLRPLN